MQLDEFHDWLKERGYADPLSSSTFRCKEHGYRYSGVFHYPMVEDRHTYYSCKHCLREIFETNPDAIPAQTHIPRKPFVPKAVPVEDDPALDELSF